MKHRKLFALLLTVVLSVGAVFTGCGSGSGQSDTIKVGFYGTLAGSGAYVDTAAKMAIEDYIEQINANGGWLGKQVQLVSYDVSKDPATESVTAATRLIEQDKVIGIVGISGTASTLPIISLCNETQTPCIASAATNTKVTMNEDTGEVYPYLFRVCFIDPYQGTALADFAYNDLDIQKVATLTRVNNAYAMGIQEYFKEQYTALGGKIVKELGYQETEVEFRAQLTAAADAGATAILVAASEYKDAGLIANQAADLGLKFTFLFPDGVYASELLNVAGDTLGSSYISVGADENDPAFADFKSSFDEKHKDSGYTANIYTYYALDSFMLLEYAVKTADSLDGPAIRDALENAKDAPCFTEAITIDPETHNPLNKSITVLTVEDGAYSVYKTYKPE